MARMYSGDKGKSGSTKPVGDEVPSWVRHEPEEIEKLVVKLAKEGNTPSQIGMKLRDSYGIPSVKDATGKKITKILEDEDLLGEIPEDLQALIKKYVNLMNHLENNPKDETARRGLDLTNSKIRRLSKYYKEEGRLSQDWTFDPERAQLYVD